MLSLLFLIFVFLIVTFISSLLILYVSITSLKFKTKLRLRTQNEISTVDLDWDRYDPLNKQDVVYPPRILHPDNSSYPMYEPLLIVLDRWSADDPTMPSQFTETLQHFDYTDTQDLQTATYYRDNDLPFKLYNIPELDRANKKWSIEFLQQKIRSTRVEQSDSKHFLFWFPRLAHNIENYIGPTKILSMSFTDWMAKTRDIHDSRYYYIMFQNFHNDSTNRFMYEDLEILSSTEGNFFVPDTKQSARGIECKVAPKGLISEMHYDDGRNMISMVRGHRRYILAHPKDCSRMDIIKNKKDPSYRQSKIDFADIEAVRASGAEHPLVIDTILRQGEVLFVPSWWFHYIVSLSYSIQCNTRFGAVVKDYAHIKKCVSEI